MDGGDASPRRRRDQLADIVRELIVELQDDDAVDAAASVAFWLLLSIPAALLAGLASLALLGGGVTAELRRITLEFVDRVFTSEADKLRTAVDALFSQPKVGLFSVSVLLAMVTLSRGFAGLIRALNVVYDVENTRGFVWQRLVAFGLALGTIATVALSTYLWVASASVGVPLVVRVPVAIGILVAWATTIFHVGPNHHTPWRYDLPGAVLAAAGWFLVSIGYGTYVRLLGGGANEIIGVAGAVLLGIMWLWLVCLILLGGGEVNEIIARRADVIEARPPWWARVGGSRTGRTGRRRERRGEDRVDPEAARRRPR